MQPSAPITSNQLRVACLLAFVAVVMSLTVSLLLPFLLAILWAVTLSVLTFPWYAKFKAKYDSKRSGPLTSFQKKIVDAGDTLAALRSLLLTIFVICLPFVIAGSLAFRQISPALKAVEGSSSYEITSRIDKVVQPLAKRAGMEDFHIQAWWAENSEEVVKNLREPAGKFAKQAGLTLFTIVIALLSMFFFQRDGHLLRQPFFNLCGLPEARAQRILDRLAKTIRAVFTGTVIVAAIQGTIMGVTYALLGVPNSVLLGFFSIVLCIVPLLGAPVVYIPVGLLFLAQGDVTKAAIVLGVGFLIVSQIDNLLKPIFIGGQVSLHPLAIFFFVLGGIALFGPIGLVVGPMILTLVLALYDYACELLGKPTDDGTASALETASEPG
jgi:predicted PurR-regulated permease PerM